MSILEPYATQEATLERRSGTNNRGEPTYASPVTIAVRWYRENKLVLNDSGREVVASSHISTVADIDVHDKVTDWKGREQHVVQVRENFDVQGNFQHNVASLV